eukprot:TRINITY_DN20777_c0_g1_i10.p1 TRINITY_DN20777_c0_g1~~TRINITY_DN20777_c0_g1_i10.p1  ORF type:complete len:360 (-),score=77.86 TRINITY_DN20777_c0_g1_i10:524-1603(-)
MASAAEGVLTSVYPGEDVYRPTFFELTAQDQLPDVLRHAARFVVAAAAEQAMSPRMLALLSRWEGLYDAAWLLFEFRSLRQNGACFSESFYGLQRQQYLAGRKLTPLESVERERQRRQAKTVLTLRQQLLSLAFVVGLPLIRSRCEQRFREAIAVPKAVRTLRERLWASGYPLLHALWQGSSALYKLLYLLGRSEVWSPGLHLAGLQLVRHFPDPLEAMGGKSEESLAKRILAYVQQAPGAAISAALYGMQLLQWWHQREHLLQPYQPRKVPPPPPPRLGYEVDGQAPGSREKKLLLVPEDRTVCPLCHRLRRNPAVSAGGYVFCYLCLAEHTKRFGYCPVTGLPMTMESMRRILEDSS